MASGQHLDVSLTRPLLLLCVRGSLLEMMLESSLSDLREAQGVVLPFCPSLVRLLRLLQDFLFAEGTDNHALWSEKVRRGTSPPAGRTPALAARSPRSQTSSKSDSDVFESSGRKSFHAALESL